MDAALQHFLPIVQPCPFGYVQSMMNQAKISMGKLRQAYGLADNEVEKLILTLLPDKAFPLALWQEAYETYWRGFANRNAQIHGVENPPFPVLNTKHFDIHLLSYEVNYFIQKLSYSIHSNAFRIGLQYIIDCTYDNASSVFVEEKNFLIEKLSYLKGSSVVEYDTRIKQGYDYFGNDGIILIPEKAYNFISDIFYASILMDKISAIRLLHEYPLRQEVKGITQKVVQDILATPATTEEKSEPEPLPEVVFPATVLPVEEEDSIITADFLSAESAPQEDHESPSDESDEQQDTTAIPVPRALWEGKSPEAVCAEMREAGFADEVIAHILFQKCAMAKRNVGKLLHKPGLTESAYDKKANELYKKAKAIIITDLS